MFRRHLRGRVILPAIVLGVAGLIAVIIVALTGSHGSHASAAASATSSATAAAAPTSATATTPVVSASSSDTNAATASTSPTDTTTASTMPSITPLPQGTVTPVPTPSGATAEGYTSGDLTTGDNAPNYSTTVTTATVRQHWGFNYTFRCDPATTDSLRQSQAAASAFTVQLGSDALLRATTYQGSGFIDVHSSSGPQTHALVVTGACSYELDYVDFNN